MPIRVYARNAGRGQLIDESGEAFPWDPEHAAEILFARNLIVYLDKPRFDELLDVAPLDGMVVSREANGITAIRFQRGRAARWVYRTSAWGDGDWTPANVRRLMRHFAIGDYPTPGSLGYHLACLLWPEGLKDRKPPWACWQDLKNYVQGGDIRLFQPVYAQQVTEVDQNSSYLAAIMDGIPYGRPERCLQEEEAEGAAWTYGVYSFDGGRPRGASGEEVERARKCRVDVKLAGRLWAWDQAGDQWRQWAEAVIAARDCFKRSGLPVEASMTKLVGVATIGRLAMDWRQVKVTDRAEDVTRPGAEQQGDVPVGRRFWGRWEPVRDVCALLIHVACAVYARVRIQIAIVIDLVRAENQTVYMTQTDAVYFDGRAPPGLDLGDGPGQFKVQELTHVEIPAAGWVWSAEKQCLPGIPRDDERRQGHLVELGLDRATTESGEQWQRGEDGWSLLDQLARSPEWPHACLP